MFPGSWRAQELSSAIIMEIGRSSIQFKRCAMGTAFLPKIMESPRRSSAIIIETVQPPAFATMLSSWRSATSRFNLQGVQEARPSFPRSWRAQEGALPSSWRLAASRFLHSHAHAESKRELCHHHVISQKNPFNLVIYLFACVSSLYV